MRASSMNIETNVRSREYCGKIRLMTQVRLTPPKLSERANKISAIQDDADRAEFVAAKRREYDEDIDIVRLASELVVDDIVTADALRDELVRRFRACRGKDRHFSHRRHGVTPV